MKIKSCRPKKFKSPSDALLCARRLFKNQSEFAKKCGVRQQTISKWKHNGVSPKTAIAIEKALDGYVTRFDLRPDFFIKS